MPKKSIMFVLASTSLGFYNSFSTTCNFNGCLAEGNSTGMITALLVAAGAGSLSGILTFAALRFLAAHQEVSMLGSSEEEVNTHTNVAISV